jgi:hypothetical protein
LLALAGERPCLEHGFLGRASGARSIRRSRLSTEASAFRHREARLVPEGTVSVPKDRRCRGLCEPDWRLTAVRTVGARRSGHLSRSWATASSLSPGREAEFDPEVSLGAVRPKSTADRDLEATSATTDQVALEARGLLQRVGHPGMVLAETAPGWTTWERCLSNPAGPEAGRLLLQRFTRRHGDQCAFSTLPKEHPIGLLRWPRAHHATLFEPELGESIPTSWGFAGPPRRARSTIVAGATRPPGGG